MQNGDIDGASEVYRDQAVVQVCLGPHPVKPLFGEKGLQPGRYKNDDFARTSFKVASTPRKAD